METSNHFLHIFSTLMASLSDSDLDDTGIYYFKQPSPDQDKNLMFVATHIYVKIATGYLNFDFLGTFYDFNVAKSGKKSGIDDNFNERGISDFWIKGLLKINMIDILTVSVEDGSETSVTTSSESNAKTTCYNRCVAPGTNSFYAIKLLKIGSWRCKCLDLTLSPVVAEVKHQTLNSWGSSSSCHSFDDSKHSNIHNHFNPQLHVDSMLSYNSRLV